MTKIQLSLITIGLGMILIQDISKVIRSWSSSQQVQVLLQDVVYGEVSETSSEVRKQD